MTKVVDLPTATSVSMRSEIKLITAEIAENMRSTMHFERQRTISRQNVDRLAKEMEAGRFIPGIQIYIAVLPNGSKWILNGNHTLEAIASCGVATEVTLTYKPVADVDEAGSIYAVFDIQKTRTWADSMRAHNLSDVTKLPAKILPGLGIIQDGFVSSTGKIISRPERFEMFDAYKDAIDLYWEAVAGGARKSSQMLLRAGVMAVSLATLKFQPSAAFEFWQRAAHNDGLTKGTPEWALLRWLENTHDSAGHGARMLHLKAAALAWNAAFRGETREALKPNAMLDIRIDGTPWAKGVKR